MESIPNLVICDSHSSTESLGAILKWLINAIEHSYINSKEDQAKKIPLAYNSLLMYLLVTKHNYLCCTFYWPCVTSNLVKQLVTSSLPPTTTTTKNTQKASFQKNYSLISLSIVKPGFMASESPFTTKTINFFIISLPEVMDDIFVYQDAEKMNQIYKPNPPSLSLAVGSGSGSGSQPKTEQYRQTVIQIPRHSFIPSDVMDKIFGNKAHYFDPMKVDFYSLPMIYGVNGTLSLFDVTTFLNFAPHFYGTLKPPHSKAIQWWNPDQSIGQFHLISYNIGHVDAYISSTRRLKAPPIVTQLNDYLVDVFNRKKQQYPFPDMVEMMDNQSQSLSILTCQDNAANLPLWVESYRNFVHAGKWFMFWRLFFYTFCLLTMGTFFFISPRPVKVVMLILYVLNVVTKALFVHKETGPFSIRRGEKYYILWKLLGWPVIPLLTWIHWFLLLSMSFIMTIKSILPSFNWSSSSSSGGGGRQFHDNKHVNCIRWFFLIIIGFILIQVFIRNEDDPSIGGGGGGFNLGGFNPIINLRSPIPPLGGKPK